MPRSETPIGLHPVQIHSPPAGGAQISSAVTMRAYEVYCHLFGAQEAMVTGWCRGGFEVGELIAMLYARSFPEIEWRYRFQEACNNMKLSP